MLGHSFKAKPSIFPIFPNRYVSTTIFLQICGCIEAKKLDKVLLFNILNIIANIESLFLFRFLLWLVWLLLYAWFTCLLKMIFLCDWLTSFCGESWNDVLFSVCCGDLSFHQSLNNFIFRTKLILLELCCLGEFRRA